MAEQLRRTFPKKPSNPKHKPPEMMKHQEKLPPAPQPIAATARVKTEIKSVSPAVGYSAAIPALASEEISQKIIDPSTFPPGNITNRFFAVLLTMERKYGWNPFEWEEIQQEYQKLFNDNLSSLKLGIISRPGKCQINISAPHFLDNMSSIFAIIETDADHMIRIRRNMNVGNNKEIALAYAAFKRGQEERQAPPLQPAPFVVKQETIDPAAVEQRADKQAPPPFHIQTPLVLQILFTTFLALERQFGEAEFTWKDMVEVHHKLCGETLNVDLLEQVVGGMEHGKATLRNILAGQLAQVFELTDLKCKSKKNPRVRFRPFKQLSKAASRNIEWTPGKPMSKFFVEAQYAGYKASQGFVVAQINGGLALPLPQTPLTEPAGVIKHENIDLTESPSENTTRSRKTTKRKREAEEGEDVIDDNDVFEISRVKKDKTEVCKDSRRNASSLGCSALPKDPAQVNYFEPLFWMDSVMTVRRK